MKLASLLKKLLEEIDIAMPYFSRKLNIIILFILIFAGLFVNTDLNNLLKFSMDAIKYTTFITAANSYNRSANTAMTKALKKLYAIVQGDYQHALVVINLQDLAKDNIPNIYGTYRHVKAFQVTGSEEHKDLDVTMKDIQHTLKNKGLTSIQYTPEISEYMKKIAFTNYKTTVETTEEYKKIDATGVENMWKNYPFKTEARFGVSLVHPDNHAHVTRFVLMMDADFYKAVSAKAENVNKVIEIMNHLRDDFSYITYAYEKL